MIYNIPIKNPTTQQKPEVLLELHVIKKILKISLSSIKVINADNSSFLKFIIRWNYQNKNKPVKKFKIESFLPITSQQIYNQTVVECQKIIGTPQEELLEFFTLDEKTLEAEDYILLERLSRRI